MTAFTHKHWSYCCDQILARGSVKSYQEYLELSDSEQFVLIKHDVECAPKTALEIAKIEAEKGISGVYYFQVDVARAAPDIMKEIKALGHEIGYHYDVLDLCDGDLDAAISVFDSDLQWFENHGIAIRAVCPHGNPTKKRDGWNSNKDFFRCSKVRARYDDIHDIVVNSDLSRFSDVNYVSDAGYQFKLIANVHDNDRVIAHDVPVQFPNDSSLFLKSLIVSTHPHRWISSSALFFLRKFIFSALKFFVRLLSRFSAFRYLFSKMYKVARQF